MIPRTSLLTLTIILFTGCGSAVDAAGANAEGGANEGGAGAATSDGGGGNGNGGTAQGGSPSVGGGGEGGGVGGGGGGSAACEAPANPHPFEGGTGETCYERLTDGQTIPLISGPQGGYHVWVGVGCVGCEAPLHLKWGVNDPATGMLLHDTYESEAFIDVAGDPFKQFAGLFSGMPGIQWDPEAYPPVPEGTEVILWLHHVDDAGNVLAADEHNVIIGETIVWDPCAETPEAPECQQG